MVKHGRSPEHVTILPGVMPIIGETDEQAKEQLARLQSWLTPTNALALVSQRIGHDISGYPLDGPVPDFPQTDRGQAFSRALLDMARREKMTLRDLYNVTAAARGHWVVYGTPKRIADVLEEWFVGGLADGFVVMPAYFPGAFDDVRRPRGAGVAASRALQGRLFRHDAPRPARVAAPGRREASGSSDRVTIRAEI